MKRSRDRATQPFERAASARFARERARGDTFGRDPPGPLRLPRVYLPDNL